MTELRKAKCYWDVPGDMETIRLDPEGKAYKVHSDEDGRMYVIEDDDERTYLIFA